MQISKPTILAASVLLLLPAIVGCNVLIAASRNNQNPNSLTSHNINLRHDFEQQHSDIIGDKIDELDKVKVRESSEPVNYKRDDEIVHDSQLVRVYLDTTSLLYSNAAKLSSDQNKLTSNNSSKQSQEFDTHSSSSTQIPAVSGSTWSFTAPSESTTKQATTAATTIVSGNQDAGSSTQLPPVASKTVRDGSAIVCGEANSNGLGEQSLLPNRIVGGRKSRPGEFPFQVRLNIRSRRGSGICGGIVLDENHILTAAHCVTGCVSHYLTTTTIDKSEVLATVGDHAIKAQDGEQDVEIERITPHEKYDACNFYANDNDIAIVKTSTKLNFRFTNDGYGSINRPCLPKNSTLSYKDGESVIVSGWGVTRENSGALSNILRFVSIPVVNNSKCQEVYGTRVTDSHVCAGFQAGGKDSCQGDSGGPLVRIVDNKYELVGIVSFGYGCAQPGAFGVYTRVASYLDWIKANL